MLRKAVDAKPTFAMSEWAKKQTYRSPEGLAHMVAVLEELGVPTLYENPPKRPHQLPLRVIGRNRSRGILRRRAARPDL